MEPIFLTEKQGFSNADDEQAQVMDHRFSIFPKEKQRFLKPARPARVDPLPAEPIFPKEKQDFLNATDEQAQVMDHRFSIFPKEKPRFLKPARPVRVPTGTVLDGVLPPRPPLGGTHNGNPRPQAFREKQIL